MSLLSVLLLLLLLLLLALLLQVRNYGNQNILQ